LTEIDKSITRLSPGKERLCTRKLVHMTGRERILATMAREPTDRFSFDFSYTAEMKKKLMAAFEAADYQDFLEKIGNDTIDACFKVKPHAIGSYYNHLFSRKTEKGCFIDNWGVTWKRCDTDSGDIFYDVVDFPLKNAKTIKEIEEFPWPDPADDFDFSSVREGILRNNDKFAVAGGTAAVFDDSWRMRGMEQLLMDMAINPELAKLLLSKVCGYWLKFARLLLEAADGKIDIMWTRDDLGSQNGLIMSPDMCREFMIPLIKERADLYKSYGAKVFMHSCGGIYPIIGDIIECGVDALDPIQPRADRMDRRKLKAEFGNKLVFHGGIDQQKVLVYGTVDNVVRETKDCLDVLGRDGGYILAASHQLETDIPMENVMAMIETAMNYRR